MRILKQAINPLHILLVVTSSMLWFGFCVFNKDVLSFSTFSAGIELIYLPAGIRLVLVMIFGIWGAFGILVANLFLVPIQIGAQSLVQVTINSLISAFVPLITLQALQKFFGIRSNLSSLRPIHLPLLALAVSITAPLAFNLQFLDIGLTQWSTFAHNLSAMILGDFLGCLFVLIILRMIIVACKAKAR